MLGGKPECRAFVYLVSMGLVSIGSGQGTSREPAIERLAAPACFRHPVPENRCVKDAYFRGYREALAANCRWILEMDGGLSHLPEQIPQFLRAMESGADYAPGSRFCKGGKFKGKFSRRCVSWGGTQLSNLL